MATFVQRGRTSQLKVRRRGYPLQTATFDTKGEAQSCARKLESWMDRGIFADYSAARRTL
ncbi:MAG: hypothetical protein B7Z66_11895 [Chromatiales bacterium 21-64-14]|nr:MAG: hypothetical protein B7Z66_11895 [Chromatiales bacterium 21-64-14]HQU16851.1 hypothetical protein [Gammaproteobacteria bacterium]